MPNSIVVVGFIYYFKDKGDKLSFKIRDNATSIWAMIKDPYLCEYVRKSLKNKPSSYCVLASGVYFNVYIEKDNKKIPTISMLIQEIELFDTRDTNGKYNFNSDYFLNTNARNCEVIIDENETEEY